MPKIIDYEKQKEKIAQAAWRVIHAEGIENASVRKIAKEAGVSSGTLQHYFKTQSQLLEFAMLRVVELVEARFAQLNNEITEVSLASAKTLLLHLVPMNQEQELEAEVWLSLTLKALHDPSLKEISESTFEAIYQTMHRLLNQLDEVGLLKQGLNLELEARKLHMLVDALTLHRMISPESITTQHIQEIVNQQIDDLAAHDNA